MLKDYTMTPNRAGIPVWRPAQPVIGREDEHQTALTNWARMMRTQYPALTLYHHIPNGGLRDKRTAARLIGQGVLIGVPDVFIPAADVAPVRRGRWIEENGIQICSECGEEHEWEDYRAPYCDTCGARMNKEEANGRMD